MAALRGTISGPCQPTDVLAIPVGDGQADIGASSIEALGEGAYEVTDFRGWVHAYPPEV